MQHMGYNYQLIKYVRRPRYLVLGALFDSRSDNDQTQSPAMGANLI